ncbi:hypothetical protein JKF63_00207 [Porcisia hertigi]|uniref:Uncharacterized protein n=1 Tax=Porcisia hertigi TaxID=2761500 RepID=A0A836L6M2_9TRYP|nr:hypothetical protein JKF63_00207 [Porcisia hertigi]
MSCGSRGDVSTPVESVSVALGRKEADGATANHVETDEEEEQDTSSDTPQTGLGEEYRPRFRTAAIQSFEHALQQDLLIHTSRKLMYTTSDMVLSPTVAYDGFEDVESATGLLTAQTKSVGVYDEHDGAASALIFKTLGGESGTTGALASAPLNGVLLPYRSALPASPAQDGSAFLPSATAAHAKAVPLAGLITQESTEAETSKEAHQRLPPPPSPASVSSPSQVECVSVEMDMVTQETAEQLFRRCDHTEGTADGANSHDTAAHQSAPSFLGRGYSRSSQGTEDSRIGSRRPRSPTLFPPHHIETVDTAEAHWAKSPLDGDCSVPPRCSQVGVCDTGGFDTQHGGGALGSEAAVATRAAQTFSSTLLPPLEERRADNYELAKVLHRHGIHATLSGASRGLLASPPADQQPCDDLQCVGPRGISCAADPTSLSLADAMRSSVDMGTSSSQDTSVSPPQGAGHVPHRQDLMIPYSPVDDSRRLRGGPEGPRCCCGPSDPSVVEPSVIEGSSSAAVFEGVSAAVTAVSELTVVDPSVAPSRTPPSTPRRKKPPPRMLCPPTLSPSPPRFSAMDVMIIAAPNAGTSEEDDAYGFERSLFSGVAPGAEPQSRPHIGKINVSAEASNTMCTSMMTPAAAAAAASSATLSLCQSPLPTSSTVPVTASAVATVATSVVEGGAVVNVTSCSRSSEERALQDMRGLETVRQAEGVNEEGEVTESRAATNISIADRSGDGSRQVSPCCVSNGSSQPQLNYSDRSSPSSVCHPTSILQHVGAGEKLQTQLLCTTSFPQNGWSADQVSPSLLLRDHHGDTLTSRNISSSAPESIHAQIMLRSSSSASPSPIRPSTGSASDNEPLHYEAPALHSYGLSAELAGCHHEDPNNSGDDDEAHLCYDEQNSSRVESGATAAVAVAVAVAADDGDVDSTWQSATPCGLCEDGRAGAEQACVEEIRCQAEAKTAALSLQLASATARAVAAEAKAHVRELESIHLHALVKRLRSDLAVALAARERVVEKTRADVGVQIGACTDFSGGAAIAALMSSSSNLPNELSATICSERETTTLAQDSVWQGRYDTLAHEMATLKSSMADQLAVLDRLGMRPPFSEELVGAAEKRLRHVKIAHAPGTAVKANRPDATLSETPPAPAHAPCVDNAVSLCCPARGTAVTVTTKKLQESDSNTIAALLGKRKQNNHSKQQATAEATVMGTTVSETASATLALPKNRNHSAHHGSPVSGKENHPVV